jgi:hypothetical protein
MNTYNLNSFSGIDKKKYPPITYDYSQEEIAAKAGINMDQVNTQGWVELGWIK